MKEKLDILLVEDNPNDVRLLTLAVNRYFDVTIEHVETEEDYRGVLGRRSPQIILSDYSLPRFNGMKALRIRMELAPFIPFIVVTGSLNEEIAVETMKAGADDYILKENLNRLEPAIRAAISKQELYKAHVTAGEMIRSSEEKFRSIFYNHPGIVGISTFAEGKYLEVNDHFLVATGWSREEVIGRTSNELEIFPEYCSRMGLAEAVQHDGKVLNHELLFRTKSGIMRDGLFTAVRIDYEGTPCLLAQVEDITELKAAQKAREESELKFSTIFNFSPVSKIISDPADSRILDVNEKLLHDLEFSREEMVGKRIPDLGIFRDPEERVRLIRNLQEKGNLYGYDCDLRTKSGRIRNSLLYIVFLEVQGKKIQLTLASDVTELKESQQAMIRNEERFQQVSQAGGIWVWEVDANGLYTYVSPSEESILGYTPEEVVGRMHFYDLFVPDKKEEMKKAAMKAFEGRVAFQNFENDNLHRDGRRVILSTNGIPMLDKEGILLGYRGTDTDITDRKRAEQALLDKMAELERFHRLTIDRELTMIDLKKEVNALLKAAGEKEKYRIPG